MLIDRIIELVITVVGLSVLLCLIVGVLALSVLVFFKIADGIHDAFVYIKKKLARKND